jgi:MFS family permease
MKRLEVFNSWKNPMILLFGIGISNIGDWIYLIALNLIIFEKTNSVLAVSILYILKPLATIFTNVWAGSLIDRFNKRNLMVVLDFSRAIFIMLLPNISNIKGVFIIVFIINMSSSIFFPTSMTYITKLIPPKQRVRFNALRSLLQSGAFITGPSIAGLLFMIGTPLLAIYINAFSFIISGIVTLCLPNVDSNKSQRNKNESMTLKLIKNDLIEVLKYSKKSINVMAIYFLFNGMLVLTAAVDSLEAVFSKEVLHLTDTKYGLLVSIAGAGIGIGAFVNTIFSNKLRTSWMIGFGAFFLSVGYIIYAFSISFNVAAIGFFILSFSLAFANTGFDSFFQSNVNVEIMGRVGSMYGFINAIFVILFTILLGLTSHFFSIKITVIIGTTIMLIQAFILCIRIFPRKKYYKIKEFQI